MTSRTSEPSSANSALPDMDMEPRLARTMSLYFTDVQAAWQLANDIAAAQEGLLSVKPDENTPEDILLALSEIPQDTSSPLEFSPDVAPGVADITRHAFVAMSKLGHSSYGTYMARRALQNPSNFALQHSVLDALEAAGEAWDTAPRTGSSVYDRLVRSSFKDGVAPSPFIEYVGIMQRSDISEAQRTQLLQRLTLKTNLTAEAAHNIYATNVLVRDGSPVDQTPLRQHAPSLELFFDELGVPPDSPDSPGFRSALWAAWESISALRASYDNALAANNVQHMEIKDLTDEQLANGTQVKTAAIYEQASALQSYIEQFGLSSAEQLHATFGIVNFTRGSAEGLHSMLKRWNDLSQPARNMAITATTDPHQTFTQEATRFFAEFGEDGGLYFEARDAGEAARFARAVGKRERQAGREPDLNNVVVAGHGDSENVTLSQDETGAHGLNVRDYIRAITGRIGLNRAAGKVIAKPNTYKQHLGNRFRVILNACSAAGRLSRYVYNIAETMRDQHDVQVLASPQTVTDLKRMPDDRIEFETDPAKPDETIPATVYEQRHQP